MAISTTRTGLEPGLTGNLDNRSGNEPGFGQVLFDLVESLTSEIEPRTGLPVRVRHRADDSVMVLVPP
ncbi:MAG: hypothetical protein HYU66_28340 [Armatimonadetes bacterium]|nr:hypothetical protein [Armatimonadota bacterium]